MIANVQLMPGVWKIRGVVVARKRANFTAHLFEFYSYFDGDRSTALCGFTITNPRERITSPTFVLDTCAKCRKEYRRHAF